MTKLKRLTASEAEKLVLDNGFVFVRSKGSHRIYIKNSLRIVIPFHSGSNLHPKIVKQILSAIDKSN